MEHYGHKKKENEYSKKYDTLLLQLQKVNQKPLVRFLNHTSKSAQVYLAINSEISESQQAPKQYIKQEVPKEIKCVRAPYFSQR